MTRSHSQRGFAAAGVAIIVAMVLIGAGALYYFSTRTVPQKTVKTEEKNMAEQKEAMIQKGTSPTPPSGDTMMEKEDETTVKKAV